MIYTRKGDHGTTDLANGTTTPKTAAEIEAVGALDELNSLTGYLYARLRSLQEPELEAALARLRHAQHRLFAIGALAARLPHPQGLPTPADTHDLEQDIDSITAETHYRFDGFRLPAGHETACLTHMARTACRKAERRLWAVAEPHSSDCDTALAYLNRLSDWLFMLAVKINSLTGEQEIMYRSMAL